MNVFLSQNPGIGGLDELTPAEELFITSFAGLDYEEGMKLVIKDSLPKWVYTPTGISTLSYTGNKLTSIGTPDGRTITLTYTGNFLTNISDGFTSTTLSYTGNQLTQISTI